MSVSANGSELPERRQAFSSRLRYRAFIAERRAARKGANAAPENGSPAPRLADEDPNSPRRLRRSRSFWSLLSAFWDLVRGHRLVILACVGTVTISALIGLVAPASLKVVFDYILNDTPGPA